MMGYLHLRGMPIGALIIFVLVPRVVWAECPEPRRRVAGAPQFRWMGLVTAVVILAALAFVVPLILSLLSL